VVTGDWERAREDFAQVIAWAERIAEARGDEELAALASIRRYWIDELEKGRNPLREVDLRQVDREMGIYREMDRYREVNRYRQ
jgi:hypothetical protein